MNEHEAARLRALAEQLIGLTGQDGNPFMLQEQRAMALGEARVETSVSVISDNDLHLAARRELARRQMRQKFLPHEWFSEAPWNLMLDLFAQELSGREVSITSACLAAGVPTTTALRCIGSLVDTDMIVRSPDHSDERRSFVRLSHKGREKIRAVLSAMIKIETTERAANRVSASHSIP